MNTLSSILIELDSAIGFSEQARLTEGKRISGINQALLILYGMLIDSPILKRSSTITLSNVGVILPTTANATPPPDFNDGTVLYMGDSPTFEDSDEVYEVDGQIYGRYDNEDYIVFTRGEGLNGEEFQFQGVSAGTFYIEYEMGAPVLSEPSDNDNLPKSLLYITAKLAAGILTDNLLSDSSKMQIFLYGANGNPNRYTPESIMGQLQKAIRKRRIRKQRTRIQQINVIK